MSSKRRADRFRPHPGLAAEWVPPTSPADVEALRAARRRSLSPPDPWEVLAAVDLFPIRPRRTTSAGWEPFRLPPESD